MSGAKPDLQKHATCCNTETSRMPQSDVFYQKISILEFALFQGDFRVQLAAAANQCVNQGTHTRSLRLSSGAHLASPFSALKYLKN